MSILLCNILILQTLRELMLSDVSLVKVELPLWKAKNKNFRLKLKGKLSFRCFLFDVNRSFRSKVTVENVTFQSKIACYISYVFYCFLKLLFLIFFTLKINISRNNSDFDP